MPVPVTVHTDFCLRQLNTFGLAGRAAAYLPVTGQADLQALLQQDHLARYRAMPRFMLGGGSNIILTGNLDRLVLHATGRGIAVVGETADYILVRVSAGESWQALVDFTLARAIGGLENLSRIPGSVGAAPIQNIGAYGVELAERFHCLTAFDLDSGGLRSLDRAACAFGYRDSVFKQELAARAMVLDVTFALPRRWSANLRYAELAAALPQGARATMHEVAAAVTAIRQRKLPDPAQIGNAGSFFKNPIVPLQQRNQLLQRFPTLVSHELDGGYAKLAAGWLIEQCGWKGRSMGPVGVYHQQALVLVNLGGARGSDVLALAQQIQADVQARFGVQLEPEPIFVG